MELSEFTVVRMVEEVDDIVYHMKSAIEAAFRRGARRLLDEILRQVDVMGTDWRGCLPQRSTDESHYILLGLRNVAGFVEHLPIIADTHWDTEVVEGIERIRRTLDGILGLIVRAREETQYEGLDDPEIDLIESAIDWLENSEGMHSLRARTDQTAQGLFQSRGYDDMWHSEFDDYDDYDE